MDLQEVGLEGMD